MNRKVVYKICFWMYTAWFLYMFVWLISCWSRMSGDGFVSFLDACAIPRFLSYYLYAMLIFVGFEIWLFLGALLLKFVCIVVLKDRGERSGDMIKKMRSVETAVLVLHGLMVLDGIVCAGVPLLGISGMLSDSSSGIVLIGVLSMGVLFAGGILWCGFCAVIAVAAVPMVRFIVKWSVTAWAGAFDT